MRNIELFNEILACVASATEIDQADILSSDKHAEVVDARYLLVYAAHRKGFYRREIARYSKITRQAVGRMLTCFDIRRSKGGNFFEINLKTICKRLEIN